MWCVFRKELQHLYKSITGYIYLCAFSALAGLVFYSIHILGLNGNLQLFFDNLSLVLLAVIPLLTMRIVSGEKRQSTDLLLRTLPISSWAVIAGKFLVIITSVAVSLAATLVYFAFLSKYTVIDMHLLVGNYTGLMFLASAFTSIGLLISSQFSSQFSSAIVTYSVLLVLLASSQLLAFTRNPLAIRVLKMFSFLSPYRQVTYGVISFSGVLYYFAITVYCLELSKLVFGSRIGKKAVLWILLCTVLLFQVIELSHTLTDRFGWYVDITSNRIYEVSAETAQYIQDLTTPAEVIVYASREDFPEVLSLSLEKLVSHNRSMLNLRYVDLYTTPSEISRLEAQGIAVAENNILVVGALRSKLLSISDLATIDNNHNVVSINVEQSLINALLQVDASRVPQALISDSYGEEISGSFLRMLENTGYSVAYSTIDDTLDCDLLILGGPTRDMSKNTVDRLEKYLSSGGRILAFVRPMEEGLHNLYRFYSNAGIDVTPGIIIDNEKYLSNNPLHIVPGYYKHPINTYFETNRHFAMLPYSVALRRAKSEFRLGEVSPLLLTSPAAVVKEYPDDTSQQGTGPEESGPYCVAMSATKQSGKIVVYGSVEMLNDDLLDNQEFANSILIARTLHWLDEKQPLIIASPKATVPQSLAIPSDAAKIFRYVFLGATPIVFLIAGAIIVMTRRARK